MVDVNLQKGFAMPDDDDDDDDDKNTVREWEDGLPSLADLISLSQCLISPQLASAFSITSPSLAPSRSSADVALASHAAFSSLRAPRDPQLDPSPTSPDSLRVLQRCLTSGDAQGARHSELVGGHDAIVPYEKNPGASAPPGDPLKRKNSNVSVRPDDKPSFPPEDLHYQDRQGDEFQGRSAAADAKVDGLGIDSAQEHKDRLQSFGVQEDDVGFMNERNVEPEGEGCAEMNAQRPCSSEGSDAAHRLEADVEAEDAESTPSLAENPNGEVQARTLKRPRLVWTQELHKRFVDAVTHLGLRTAVPKTIMQLMNVEGLTRENVASHLQKYRLYLKRMQQGLGGEASASSDHIFASTPLPVNLVTSGRFPPGVPSQLQDVNQVPFLLSGSHVPINRGHVAGILPAPLPPMDPYSYGAYSRPAHRITQGEMPDLHWWRQHHSDPNHPVMKK